MPEQRPTAGGDASDGDGASTAIDEGELEELASLGCTRSEAAVWFGRSESEFRGLLRSTPLGLAWRRGRGIGRIRLRRAQFALAEKNTAMATLLGKRLLGQRDVAGREGGGAVTIILDTGIKRDPDPES